MNKYKNLFIFLCCLLVFPIPNSCAQKKLYYYPIDDYPNNEIVGQLMIKIDREAGVPARSPYSSWKSLLWSYERNFKFWVKNDNSGKYHRFRFLQDKKDIERNPVFFFGNNQPDYKDNQKKEEVKAFMRPVRLFFEKEPKQGEIIKISYKLRAEKFKTYKNRYRDSNFTCNNYKIDVQYVLDEKTKRIDILLVKKPKKEKAKPKRIAKNLFIRLYGFPQVTKLHEFPIRLIITDDKGEETLDVRQFEWSKRGLYYKKTDYSYTGGIKSILVRSSGKELPSEYKTNDPDEQSDAVNIHLGGFIKTQRLHIVDHNNNVIKNEFVKITQGAVKYSLITNFKGNVSIARLALFGDPTLRISKFKTFTLEPKKNEIVLQPEGFVMQCTISSIPEQWRNWLEGKDIIVKTYDSFGRLLEGIRVRDYRITNKGYEFPVLMSKPENIDSYSLNIIPHIEWKFKKMSKLTYDLSVDIKYQTIKILSNLYKTPIKAQIRVKFGDILFNTTSDRSGMVRIPIYKDTAYALPTLTITAKHFQEMPDVLLDRNNPEILMSPEIIGRKIDVWHDRERITDGWIQIFYKDVSNTDNIYSGDIKYEVELPYGTKVTRFALSGKLDPEYKIKYSSLKDGIWTASLPIRLDLELKCHIIPLKIPTSLAEDSNGNTLLPIKPFEVLLAGKPQEIHLKENELRIDNYNKCMTLPVIKLKDDPNYEDYKEKVPGKQFEIMLKRRLPGVAILIDVSKFMEPFYESVGEELARVMKDFGSYPKLYIGVLRGKALASVYKSSERTNVPRSVSIFFDRNRVASEYPDVINGLANGARILIPYNKNGKLMRNRIIYIIPGNPIVSVRKGFKFPLNAEGIDLYVIELYDPKSALIRRYAENLTTGDKYFQVTPQEFATYLKIALSTK